MGLGLSSGRALYGKLPASLRLLRPHHWIKNLFVAAPLFFTPDKLSLAALTTTALAVLIFSAAASAVYILNDVFDAPSDREDPRKAHRPIAAGEISARLALVFGGVLAGGALFCAYLLNADFAVILAGYLLLNLCYSAGLKHVSILDVMIVSLGFVLRLFAGAALFGIALSPWIVVITGLLALFLAFAKRRDDLANGVDSAGRRSLDGYNLNFLDMVCAALAAVLIVAYLVYTTDPAVIARSGSPHLYVTSPFVVYGVLRYLQLTMVLGRSGSPTKVALTDPPIILSVAAWIAVFGTLLYG